MAERAAIPAETDFIQNWTLLARKSAYCRQRLAKIVQVSTRTLDRYFQKHLSLSVQEWLSELQLADAYNLVMTGKPLKAISFDVGFKQPSDFTKFKARFGIPPSLLFQASCVRNAQTAQRVCRLPAGDTAIDNHNDSAGYSYAE